MLCKVILRAVSNSEKSHEVLLNGGSSIVLLLVCYLVTVRYRGTYILITVPYRGTYTCVLFNNAPLLVILL